MDKKEVLKRLVDNGLLDEYEAEVVAYETEIFDDCIKTDIKDYKKETLLKAEKVLGAKSFEVEFDAHMEMTFGLFYLWGLK